MGNQTGSQEDATRRLGQAKKSKPIPRVLAQITFGDGKALNAMASSSRNEPGRLVAPSRLARLATSLWVAVAHARRGPHVRLNVRLPIVRLLYL